MEPGASWQRPLLRFSRSWVGVLGTPVFLVFPGGSDGKEAACNVGDLGLISGLVRPPGGGHGHSNILVWRMPMVRGLWQATVHGVAKSQI